MTTIAYGIALAVIWVLAWGSPSPANILGGLAVAAVLMAVSPDTWPRPSRSGIRLRPIAIARFAAQVLLQVVLANVALTRQVLSRRPPIVTGVVAVPLPECSDGLLTLVANVMSVTPGTMPVEVSRHPTVLYVHALSLDDADNVRREVHGLAALAYRAFGTEAAIAAMDALVEEATP